MPGAQEGARAFYGPVGQVQVLWSVDVRRYADDSAYRDACDAFISAHIIGASLRTVDVAQDDAGQLWMGAWTWQHADGSFRRDAAGRVVTEGIVVQLPGDVELPR